MGKSNSDFGDLIVWGLGIFALTEVFGKDTHTGTRIFFDENIYIQPLEPSEPGKLPDNGITTIYINKPSFKVDPVIDPITKKYKVKGYSIDFYVRMTINSAEGLDITKFDDYYKADKSYTIKDYVGTFNTSEGVKYHERLHFEGFRRIIKSKEMQQQQKIMDNEIKNLRAEIQTDLVAMVYRRILRYIDLIDKEEKKPLDPKNKSRHREIALEEWRYYHDTFKPMKDFKDTH